MRVQSGPKRICRRAAVAVLLAAAAFSFSGCWAQLYSFYGPPNIRDDELRMTKKVSAQAIWDCTAQHGAGNARARCLLGDVRALCGFVPISGFSQATCNRATEDGHTPDMDSAIEGVLGYYDCLVYYRFNVTGNPTGSEAWGVRRGARCPD